MTDRRDAPADATSFFIGVVATAIVTAVWVVLTARTGTTYHLFPFVVAASLGVMSRLGGAPLNPAEAAVTTAGGLVAVAAGWFVLVAIDETSAITFVADQPGGVAGETAVFALLGVAFSAWWVRRERRA